jgi:hypothetical protein
MLKIFAFMAMMLPAAVLAQTINAPTGTVTTSDGASWSWGGAAPQAGQYYVLRNGVSADGGEAAVMEVSGGLLYAENTSVPPGVWFLWNGSGWTEEASAPPTSTGGGTTTTGGSSGGSTTPTQPSGGGPTLLTGSITLTAPLANWYQMNSSSVAIATLPPCSAISAPSYFDTTGVGPLVLQLSSGSWVDQPPGAQTVGLWVYGPSATAWVSSDGTNCHISFGGAPPTS